MMVQLLFQRLSALMEAGEKKEGIFSLKEKFRSIAQISQENRKRASNNPVPGVILFTSIHEKSTTLRNKQKAEAKKKRAAAKRLEQDGTNKETLTKAMEGLTLIATDNSSLAIESLSDPESLKRKIKNLKQKLKQSEELKAKVNNMEIEPNLDQVKKIERIEEVRELLKALEEKLRGMS
ncbi:partner of Y14 and mago B-like isoform X2 [Zophobas morio]|uniref:partner of Y14 and mago B-like isoform X2 n=1 Tax=Zophobas morio TaxID=2755281 RepID=UPI003082CCED